jgi:hypothetical protein
MLLYCMRSSVLFAQGMDSLPAELIQGGCKTVRQPPINATTSLSHPISIPDASRISVSPAHNSNAKMPGEHKNRGFYSDYTDMSARCQVANGGHTKWWLVRNPDSTRMSCGVDCGSFRGAFFHRLVQVRINPALLMPLVANMPNESLRASLVLQAVRQPPAQLATG